MSPFNGRKKLRAGFSPKQASAEDIAKIEALGNIALSLTPGIGFLKDGGELLSGKDSVTGEALGVGGTLLAGIGLTGIPADEAAKILKAFKSLRGTDEAARIADELAETASQGTKKGDGFAEPQVVATRDAQGRFTSAAGGHTATAARGHEALRNYRHAVGKGYRFEYTLPGIGRADAVNFENRIVRELKPDNPRAIQDGRRQVERYRQELERLFGGNWTAVIDTYTP